MSSFAQTLRQLRGVDPGSKATLRFPVKAGVGLRTSFRRELTSYCWSRDLQLNLQEQKGFLETLFLVKVEGPVRDLIPLLVWVADLDRQFNGGPGLS